MSRSVLETLLALIVVGGRCCCPPARPRRPIGVRSRADFVFDGTAPAPANIDDRQGSSDVCGGHDLVDQSLVVATDGGLANVVVWVRSKVKVNPDYAKSADDKGDARQPLLPFRAARLGLRVGQTLVIKNSDPVAHNTKIDGAKHAIQSADSGGLVRSTN